MHQKSMQMELALEGWGEAPPGQGSGEAGRAAHGKERSGSEHSQLMERVVARENAVEALKRVRRNKGSPGIDGMRVGELEPYLYEHWKQIRERLLAGTYQPNAVKRQLIPKGGGGMRELGIPTVLDRFVQQLMLQVLQPIFDPTFSEHSHGFRPGRRAHDAVRKAQQSIQDGRRWVVDVDLERRGHGFVRYADDCNGYVKSKRAGERVLAALRRNYAKLRLQVNEEKTTVARVWDRTFLGYSFWVAAGRKVKLRVAPKALEEMKQRVREITTRNGGRSMTPVSKALGTDLPGWKNYFKLADTPGVFRDVDGWIHRRLRALQLKQWNEAAPRTVNCVHVVYLNGSLRKGLASDDAGGGQRRLARCKRLCPGVISSGSESLGSTHRPQLTEPPDADPHVRWCGRGVARIARYPLSPFDICRSRIAARPVASRSGDDAIRCAAKDSPASARGPAARPSPVRHRRRIRR